MVTQRIQPKNFKEAWMITAGWEWLLIIVIAAITLYLEDLTNYLSVTNALMLWIGFGLYMFIVLPVWRWETRKPSKIETQKPL